MRGAVIFDVDGTLVDSVTQHAQAWQDAFRAFGHEFRLDDIRGQIGKGGDQLLPFFLDERTCREQGEAINSRRAGILKERYLGEIKGFPRVRALVEHLQAQGWQVALASSAKGDELETYKKLADITDLIRTNTSSDDAEHSKPEPDIFQAALDKLGGMAPADAFVIGDTPYDAEAAAKAGVRSIGVTCGGWTEAELRRAGCIAVYRDPADLLDQYEHSPLAAG